MVYVPGYEHDIFLSYAHVDNEPMPGFEKGWVTLFVDCIKTKLAQLLGRSDIYDFWMDYELAFHVKLTPQIMDALHHTAVMILILSPGYVASDWCQREKNTFLKFIKEGESRVFIIERLPIESQDRPPEFNDLEPLHAWVCDGDGKPPRVLGYPDPSIDSRAYYGLIDRITYELASELKNLKKRQEGVYDDSEKQTIFLAEGTDDLEQERTNVKSYLNQFSIRVLPNTWYSQDPVLFRQSVEKDLDKCSAFIQLLSGLTGRKPMELPKGYLQLQFELAKAKQKPIFQWRSPSLDISSIHDEDHRALIEGSTVRAEGIEDFKRTIKNFILNLSAKKSKSLTAFVFVNIDTADRPLADRVCSVLDSNGIGYSLPLNSGDPDKIRSDLEENLIGSNGIIIIYGSSTVDWVRKQLQECRKILSKREQPVKAFAVFEGPPEEKSQIDFKLPDLQFMNFRKGVEDAILEKELKGFIERISKGGE